MKEELLSKQIIKAYYTVYNKLGYCFLEKVYENALFTECCKMGLACKKQHPINVFYDEVEVGLYYADLLIEDKIIVELKASETLCEDHECQLINYLRATDIEVGLLFNFGKEPEFRRKIFDNKYKKSSHRT